MSALRYQFFEELISPYLDEPFLLLESGASIRYRDFLQRSVRLLNHLVHQGARHGDRVVVSLDNRPEYLELAMALALGGMTLCPLDPEVSIAQLKKTKALCRAAMTITSYDQLAYAVDEALPDCARQGGLDEPFLIIFSSGTTGAPKGIVQTLKNFFGAARAFALASGFAAGKVTLHNWPMFYNAGLFNLFACPLVSGGRVALAKRFAARDLAGFWQSLDLHKPDYVYLSPTMATTLTKTARFIPHNPECLRAARVISTSSILYPSIKEAFLKQFGAGIAPCFGITELGGSFSMGNADSAPYSVGRVMPEVAVSRDDEANGELLVATPYMALGYLNQDGELDPFDRSQAFRTGDIGYLRDGELFISGRIKDAIKKGGEFINLAEIEDLVHGAGLCEECYAVGRLDEFWGETYDVFFVAGEGAQPTAVVDELRRLFNASLPQLQRPDRIVAVDSIPRTASGKPMKRLMRYQEGME
ncbi:class I adenylate-forming enzyme family protein [Chromobacterium paludis]|uniref:Acyl--CoA ligase n=1 Tax=Chromobacterium paludis TaxID=2605945 RepID=A0A5C1DIK7_9NEIS|nr:class I adenylate-forming enzyme family protein [Chromobacterium paludis]QEL56625.1 acyl--CoA ligase [Chromobacterium paludis]